ncbi:MAG: hypothetical protein ACRDU8_10080, partial [Egibacteraceae bacterium]
MLPPADAAVVQRDPALPGLGLVLDPAALVGWLDAALPDTWIVDAEARYVRYKPGGSCVVAYRFHTAGGEVDGFAKAYRRGAEGKAAKALDKAVPSVFGGPGVAASDEHRVSVQLFPNDRSLPALRVLGDPSRRARLLRRLTDDDAVRLVPLRYKPERRWVGRVDGPGGPCAVVRLYAGRPPAAGQAFTST